MATARRPEPQAAHLRPTRVSRRALETPRLAATTVWYLVNEELHS